MPALLSCAAGPPTPTPLNLCQSPGASALAGNVGDVQGEAGAPLARTSDEGALGRAPRTRTQPVVSLDGLNAANVGGRGTRTRRRKDHRFLPAEVAMPERAVSTHRRSGGDPTLRVRKRLYLHS